MVKATRFNAFKSRIKGASALGYGLLLGLIGVTAIAAITTTGEEVACLLDNTASQLSGDDWGGCYEYVLAQTGKHRDQSPPQQMSGYDLPAILPGQTVTLTRTASISNGSQEYQQSFTYPGNGAPVVATGPEQNLGVQCDSGFIANASNDACVTAPNAPTLVGFTHASNGRQLSAQWVGGSGWSNCQLAIANGGSFTTLGSPGSCHNGSTTISANTTLNGKVSSGWGGEDIVLIGTQLANPGAGQQAILTMGSLSCDDQLPGSDTPTPDMDEDCNASFDNYKLDTVGATTLTATPNSTSNDLKYLAHVNDTQAAAGGGIYLASPNPSSNTSSLAINTLYLNRICQCYLNDTSLSYITSSAQIILVHYGQNRTDSVTLSTHASGDPVRCSNGSSTWSYGGTTVYYQGVQSMQCSRNRYF